MKNSKKLSQKSKKNIKKKEKDYFGALKGIGSFTKEDETKGQLD